MNNLFNPYNAPQLHSTVASKMVNVWLFAVAGIGGFKNGAQRNVKADLL